MGCNKAALLTAYEQFGTMTYDLNQLKEFNHALVSGFEYEGALTKEAQDMDRKEALLHACLQHHDVLTAYLYAQQQVLPNLKADNFAQVTETDLLTWLDQIHLRIARTLALDATAAGEKDAIAGQPSKRILIRWRINPEVGRCINAYYGNLLTLDEILGYCEKLGIAKNMLAGLIKIFDTIKNSTLNDLLESEKSYAEPGDQIIFAVLMTRYYNNELTAEQKNVVDQAFNVCPAPYQRPALREQFARELLIKLKQVDRYDLDQVAGLARWVFYQITEGHWYFNGNGRAATCFMNTVLRSQDKPSILIRHPGERDDPSSSYNQAIKNVNKQPELLEQHIKQRILDYQSNGDYQDKTSAAKNDIRMRWGKVRVKLLRYFPEFDSEAHNDKLLAAAAPLINQAVTKGEEWYPFLETHVQALTTVFEQLSQQKTKKIISDYQLNQNGILSTDLDHGLRKAAAFGHVTNVKFLVEELKCDVNKQDDVETNGKTPLHWAVIKQREDVVKFLFVECRARTDIPDRSAGKKTALMYAEDSSPAIKKLLGIAQSTPEPLANNAAAPTSG